MANDVETDRGPLTSALEKCKVAVSLVVARKSNLKMKELKLYIQI